ncbi:hypothetical protein JMJ35_010619 [Cladonia borealis]|uniref:Nudix hydrolase domain-containing protein n=1 Tax=Cladonia borealis TaxID=184061 RepID=A0AA39QR60_9LECA|nr:hypothetical protein JMJ35_010619 [Cladonia borealis]
MSDFYYFMIEGHEKPFGYVHSSFIAAMMPWSNLWSLNHKKRFLTLHSFPNDVQSRTNAMQTTLRSAYNNGTVSYWANELFPIYSSTGGHILDMDGCGVDPFGIVSYAVHMIAYVTTKGNEIETRKFWVPRRSKTKMSYPGMLDNTVGGSLRSGERPIDCIVREAAEEGGVPEEYTREHVKACGTLSYQMDRTDDGKEGRQHQVQYLYEMEVPEGFVPKPCDGEVEEFMLMGIEEVVGALRRGEFKLNCGMTWMSYLVRHGIVDAENEERLVEICARMHRKLDLFVV